MHVCHWVTVLGKISHSVLCHAPRAIVGLPTPTYKVTVCHCKADVMIVTTLQA